MTPNAPSPSGQALLTAADLNTTINHEPRVADLRLAEALGFRRPADIRELIERHREALERFGEVFRTVRKTSAKGGRPGKTYWLSKRQALYLCTKSEAALATETTISMVEIFDAWQRGQLDGLTNVSPGQYRVRIAGQDLLVDASAYQIGEGQQAVVCGYDGKIDVLPGPLTPSFTRELGKRSVLAPARLTRSDRQRRETRATMYIVLGRVVSAAEVEPEKPVRVKAHRRALPATTREPGKFASGSDILRDFYSLVMSANLRREKGDAPPDFGAALESVLSDLLSLEADPAHRPRGATLDWNHYRGSQALADRLKAKGTKTRPLYRADVEGKMH